MQRTQSSESRVIDKPPLPLIQRPISNNPSHSEPASRRESTLSGRQSPSPSSIYRVNPPTQISGSPSMARSTSAENMKPKVIPFTNYSTLPHLHGAQVLHQIQQQLQQHEMNSSFESGHTSTTQNSISSFQEPTTPISKNSGVVSFGKSFFRLKRNKRASSAPDLGEGLTLLFPLIITNGLTFVKFVLSFN